MRLSIVRVDPSVSLYVAGNIHPLLRERLTGVFVVTRVAMR